MFNKKYRFENILFYDAGRITSNITQQQTEIITPKLKIQ